MIEEGISNSIFEKYSSFLMDMDGVLWKGPNAIESSKDFMKKLRELKKNVFFITNNSSACRDDILSKLKSLGFEAYKEEIIGSSYIAAQYIKKYHPEIKKAFISGMSGVKIELEEAGISTIGWEPFYQRIEEDINKYTEFELDPEVGAVVAGIDYNFNYKKVSIVRHYYAVNKAILIATNKDTLYNYRDKIMPGAGNMIKAYENCTEEFTLVGKPSKFPLEHILSESIKREDCLMIGDNMETDILFGKENGLDSLLVMTGVTDEETLQQKIKELGNISTFISQDLKLLQ